MARSGSGLCRAVNTRIWSEPEYAEYDPDTKLLYLYLVSNERTNAAGAYTIDYRRIAFETGLDQAYIEQQLSSWKPHVHWWPEHRIVWVRQFYDDQPGAAHGATRDGKDVSKFDVGAAAAIADLPDEVRRVILDEYPGLTTMVEKARAKRVPPASPPPETVGMNGATPPRNESAPDDHGQDVEDRIEDFDDVAF